MLAFSLSDASSVRHVLALGSHSDDIEIGCGATILSLTRAQPKVQVTWVVLSAEGARGRSASQRRDLPGAAAVRAEVIVHGFRDGYFPYVGGDVKDVFEALKSRLHPDLILTPAATTCIRITGSFAS